MQNHIIKRLTFSLHFHSGPQAKQLEYDVINIYRKQVEQLLDEYFSKLAGSDVEYQIDKLELDLGKIKSENLRTEMPGRISEQLSKNSNNGLVRTANIILEQEKQMTLLSHFIETGRLPWWAERSHIQTLGQLVEKLCIDLPTELKGLMLHVIKDEYKIRRLINQLSDQCLSAISGLYLSGHDVVLVARQYDDLVALFAELDRQKDIRGIYTPIQLSADDANHGRIKLREHYWQNVLISLAYEPTGAFSCDQLLLDTLVSLTSNNDAYRSLITRLDYAARQLKDNGYKFSTRLPDLTDKFATETANIPEDAVASPAGLASGEYAELMESAEINSSSSKKKARPEKTLTRAARQKIFRASATQGRARDEHNITNEPSTKTNSSSSKKKVSSEKTLTRAARQKIFRASATQGRARDEHNITNEPSTKTNSSSSKKKARPEKALTGVARQKIFRASAARGRARDQRNIIKDPFTASNEDYIYNAGLVIVWPYLPKFFLNLGMVNNNHFIDVDTVERAALLLQYLVEPVTEIPESLLSLNKLLCGLELSWPLPSDFTPTEREQSECDALLNAVKYHWDVLKNMSIERVRLDFFQRQGILRPRDGNWQLQVEHQTHDILMQKLPWPIGMIKLPWMDYMLFVQWD